MYDIIVVGGGPAGLSAALYALRAEKSVLVLEKNNFGGQIALSHKVENYPGLMSVSGLELTDVLLNQVTEKGGEVDFSAVTGVEDRDGVKIVHTSDGDKEAKAVILATGATHRKLGLPREADLTGSGVSYCAICDGAFFKGRTVAVVGGGDAAVQDAILLSDQCEKVYLVHRREEFRAEQANVTVMRARSNIEPLLPFVPVALEGDTQVQGLTVEDVRDGSRRTLDVDGVFIAVGFVPQNGDFAGVAALDDFGWFAAGENCLTETPGVFVAGDCRKKDIRQLTTAVGDGSVAALAACQYIDRV